MGKARDLGLPLRASPRRIRPGSGPVPSFGPQPDPAPALRGPAHAKGPTPKPPYLPREGEETSRAAVAGTDRRSQSPIFILGNGSMELI